MNERTIAVDAVELMKVAGCVKIVENFNLLNGYLVAIAKI